MNRTSVWRPSIALALALMLFAGPTALSPAVAQTRSIDVPNTRLYNFVDAPATIVYSQFGEATVPLNADGTGIINIRRFRQVSVLIGTTSATSFSLAMGKISGSTLAAEQPIPVDQQIHTFDVVGPELVLWLKGGTPGSTETVQLWVYLRS
jgi:hypothetical protein